MYTAGTPWNCQDLDFALLKQEYLQTLKKVRKTNNIYKEQNKQIRNHQLQTQIGILNAVEKDLFSTICEIEEYLSWEQREYLHRRNENYRKNIYNSRREEGFVPKGRLGGFTTEEIFCNAELRENLLDIINTILTPKQFEIIYLYYFSDYTQEEIARKLNLERNSVHTHLQRSIEKIRQSELFLNFLEKI